MLIVKVIFYSNGRDIIQYNVAYSVLSLVLSTTF